MEENNNNSPIEEGAGSAEGQADGTQDPVKNIKAEFNRKLENATSSMQEQLRAQTELLQRTLEQLTAAKQPVAVVEDVDPVLDPAKFRQQIKDEVKREVVGEVEQRSAISQRTQQEIMSIQAMYPEFSQDNSEAAKLVMQKYQSLPSSKKGTPEATKLIMLEAAAELGLVSKKNRKNQEQSEDDFTFSGSSSGGQGTRRRESQGKVDPKTVAMAELLGLNVNDPTVRKNLEDRTKRDKWGSWRS